MKTIAINIVILLIVAVAMPVNAEEISITLRNNRLSQYQAPYVEYDIKNHTDATIRVRSIGGWLYGAGPGNGAVVNEELNDLDIGGFAISPIKSGGRTYGLHEIYGVDGLRHYVDPYTGRPLMPPGTYIIRIDYVISKSDFADCMDTVSVKSTVVVVGVGSEEEKVIFAIRGAIDSSEGDMSMVYKRFGDADSSYVYEYLCEAIIYNILMMDDRYKGQDELAWSLRERAMKEIPNSVIAYNAYVKSMILTHQSDYEDAVVKQKAQGIIELVASARDSSVVGKLREWHQECKNHDR